MNKEELNIFLKHENYYKNDSTLINNPKPLEDQGEPFICFHYDSQEDLEYSIIIPVHNQEEIICTNILSVIYNVVGEFEIIIVFDNCTDSSEERVVERFRNFDFRKTELKRFICISQPTPIFETSCENIGFRISKGKYVMNLQSDMRIMTYAFNYILSNPFRKYEDVFSVSGRCTHEWPFYGKGFGKIGEMIERPLSLDFTQMNKFFIMDTSNRPLMFLKSRLEELGYLDESNFVLGDDDHDINMRAKIQKNWITGYVPIEFYSPLSHGTMRKGMNNENKIVYEKRLKRRNNPFLFTNTINRKSLEIREL